MVNETPPDSRILDHGPVDWAVSPSPVAYDLAVATMHQRVQAILDGQAAELIWLLEHPPLYTAGTSAKPSDLLPNAALPVFKSERGGQYTYHGPGQRVAYVMLDLRTRGRDIRAFVQQIEAWVIEALSAFNVKSQTRCGRVGVWVDRTQSGGPLREDKIAAIGLRVRKWVSFHGVSINVEPNLHHFDGIIPCGIKDTDLGVTSLVDLGLPVTLDDLDVALKASFEAKFGPTRCVPSPLG